MTKPEHILTIQTNGDIKVNPAYVGVLCEAIASYQRTDEATITLSAQAAEIARLRNDEGYFASLVFRAQSAAAKASVKFSQPNYVTLKIAEEAGEVVRSAVHYAEGRMGWSEVEGEIVQLLAMLIRFVTEGDHVNGIIPPTHASLHNEGSRDDG